MPIRSGYPIPTLIMKMLLVGMLLSITILAACSQEDAYSTLELNSLVSKLKDNGVDGRLDVGNPNNSDMDYMATYVISAFTSTRIISFFKFKDVETAKTNLELAMDNPKMTGQARNGSIIMAVTFYPPDEEAVDKIRELFIAHQFN